MFVAISHENTQAGGSCQLSLPVSDVHAVWGRMKEREKSKTSYSRIFRTCGQTYCGPMHLPDCACEPLCVRTCDWLKNDQLYSSAKDTACYYSLVSSCLNFLACSTNIQLQIKRGSPKLGTLSEIGKRSLQIAKLQLLPI